MASLLLVDDDPEVLDALQRTLQSMQLAIRTAPAAAEALALLAEAPADVVVSDYDMPGMDGVSFLRKVRESWPYTQRVMLTGADDRGAIEEASIHGDVDRFISKPWDGAQLRVALRSALTQRRLDVENARL